MMKLVRTNLLPPHKRPLVANAREVVEDFALLHEEIAIFKPARRRRQKDLRHDFPAHNIDNENTASPERREHVFCNKQVLIPFVEITKRGKHAEREVERVRP